MIRRSLLVIAVAGAFLAGPQLAQAITRTQANAIAVKALKPKSADGHRGVIVFGLPKPLKAVNWVMTLDPPSPGQTTYTKPIRKLGRKTWLFWEDLQPGARFEHPSKLLLVDDETGHVRQLTKLKWVPLVDGRKPAFLQTREAYSSTRYQVFRRAPTLRKPAARVLDLASTAPLERAAVPPGVFVGDCIVMIGDWRDPNIKNDFPAMAAFGKLRGIQVFYASKGQTATTDPPDSEAPSPDGSDLKRNVRDLVQRGVCDDVFIYMSAHGPDTGPPSVVTGITEEVSIVGGEATFRWHLVTANDIAAIAEENPTASFKLAVDACFSGRFVPVVADKGQLLVAETSSAATETSQSALPSADRTDNPNGIGEFTNGLLAGMQKFFDDDAAVAAALKSGRPLLAVAIEKGHALGGKADLAAANGLTHPQSWVSGTAPPSPLTLELTGASYLHPKASTESFVCVTVETEPGASVHVTAAGPGTAKPEYPSLVEPTATADANGKATLTFTIDRAGDWTFQAYVTRLSDGAVSPTATLTTNVPPPPPDDQRPAEGPFHCPTF